MKVLWFEVTQPHGYISNDCVLGGWQDSLEVIVKKCSDIELLIAFQSDKYEEIKVVDNVTYIPIKINKSFVERLKCRFSWFSDASLVVSKAVRVIEKFSPDIIHVFGNEWPWGLVAEHTDIPVVIHIQGSIVPYYNAILPPKYSTLSILSYHFPNPVKMASFLQNHIKNHSWLEMEKRIWKCVDNYMGRTNWDYALSRVLAPKSKYYHVEEALRPMFLNTEKLWQVPSSNKIKIITTGISTFWKGPDMLLKTASVLKQLDVEFEWTVAGNIDDSLRKMIEKKEKTTFKENNVNILGFVKPDKLIELLSECTMMVHTAYIENSPNSICEAQCLGVPVVSTNVGGISTLVRDGVDGILVPANDPWQMVYNIVSLSHDTERMKTMSRMTRERALSRHNPDNILGQLLDCYRSILK